MRLEWLEDIKAIAETGSFGAAAERRNLTQSAFSRRIKQIEEYVGVELFDRARKPIRLKPTTIAQSEQILLLAAGLRQLTVDLQRGEQTTGNRVIIACQHSLTASRIPAILQQMLSQDEGLNVRLRSANLDVCTSLILSRQADVAIVFRMAHQVNEIAVDFIEELAIGTDRLIPVSNAALPDGPAAGSELTELSYIAYPPDVFFGQVMEREILPFLDPIYLQRPKVETALTFAAVEMAIIGTGIAWVPESLARSSIESGRLIDLSNRLPACALQIRAMRLQGHPNLAESILWSVLMSLGNDRGRA